MLKLPPYGKKLADLQKSGNIPINSIYIFIGADAFKKAANFIDSRPGTMCLPPYECPSIYQWPVKNCDILVFDTSGCEPEYLNDLAYYLYESEAKVVRWVTHDFDVIKFDN